MFIPTILDKEILLLNYYNDEVDDSCEIFKYDIQHNQIISDMTFSFLSYTLVVDKNQKHSSE